MFKYNFTFYSEINFKDFCQDNFYEIKYADKITQVNIFDMGVVAFETLHPS